MKEQEWNPRVAWPPDVPEMKLHSVDVGMELGVAVQRGLPSSPVELVEPGVEDVVEVSPVDAVDPRFDDSHLTEACAL